MRKQSLRLTAASLLTVLLLYSAGMQTPPAAAAATVTDTSQTLQQQAQHFVDELTVQPHFAKWKQATLHISPLGPGTHSWLVLVKQQEQVVGYLVINAVEHGGYQLGEYGTGSQPLFDEQTLQQSINRLELLQPANSTEALYVHPLIAAWKITSAEETYYTDAMTGEQLPVQPKDWFTAAEAPLSPAMQKQAPADANLLKAVSLDSFNPYAKLPWLTKDPLPLSTSSYSSLFVNINDKEQLRYTAELFDHQMLYAWSVVGYNKWNSGDFYIALEATEDGNDRRYIPLLLLLELGHFYR